MTWLDCLYRYLSSFFVGNLSFCCSASKKSLKKHKVDFGRRASTSKWNRLTLRVMLDTSAVDLSWEPARLWTERVFEKLDRRKLGWYGSRSPILLDMLNTYCNQRSNTNIKMWQLMTFREIVINGFIRFDGKNENYEITIFCIFMYI